jgi:hypothetical protein
MARSKLLFLCAFLAASFSLGGCNLVISPTPVFTAADAEGAAPLKPGLWASPDKNCQFDEAKPASEWPSCAQGSVITPTQAYGVGSPEKATPYVLASGDPRVLQAIADLSDKGSENASVKTNGPIYMFIAVKPLASDMQGRIIKAEAWFIQCGPPPPKPKDNSPDAMKPEAYATKHPLPGMKMDNGACAPADKAAVRNAAGPSRKWADQLMTLHWVRDGDK